MAPSEPILQQNSCGLLFRSPRRILTSNSASKGRRKAARTHYKDKVSIFNRYLGKLENFHYEYLFWELTVRTCSEQFTEVLIIPLCVRGYSKANVLISSTWPKNIISCDKKWVKPLINILSSSPDWLQQKRWYN